MLICSICGEEFIPIRWNSKYCSKSCSKKADINRKKVHYESNKQQYIDRSKLYAEKHHEKIKRYRKNRDRVKVASIQKRYYNKNKDKILEKCRQRNSTKTRKDYMKRYSLENKEKLNSNSRKYKRSDKGRESGRNGHLKRKYNITLETYNKMLISQDNKCKICNEKENTVTKKEKTTTKELSVDHCHISGKVRNLLCFSCNSTLGKVNEDINILKSMIAYIEKWDHLKNKE